MNLADTLKCKLRQAIDETVSTRGSYSDAVQSFSRHRKLPLTELITFMLTMTGGTLARELYDAGITMAVSSFVESRKRLGYLAFSRLLNRFNSFYDDTATLKSYKIWSIDGSTLPCPRNKNSKNYYTSKANPAGYCNIHANICYDVLNQVIIDVDVGEGDSRRSHDGQGALYTLVYKRKFLQPTILLLDRGYEGYNTIQHLLTIPNLFFVMRVKNDGLRPVRELPENEGVDKMLEWTISTRQTKFSKEQGDIYIPIGSTKGKTNGPNTRIARWDFINGETYRFPDSP